MKDLVKIIKANPGCIARIDNDSWTLRRETRDKNPYLAEEEEKGYSKKADDWDEKNVLAHSSDEPFRWPKGRGDFASGCYGGDLLEALAIIAGINVEGV